MKEMALFVGMTHCDFIFYSYLSPILILTYHSLVPFSSFVYFIHNEYLCFGIIFPIMNIYSSLHFLSSISSLYSESLRVLFSISKFSPYAVFPHPILSALQANFFLFPDHSNVSAIIGSEKALNKQSLLC